MSEAKSLVDISNTVDADALQYIRYLKNLYRNLTPTRTSDHQWPPSSTRRVFNLAMVKEKEVRSGRIDDPFVRMTITGKIDDILHVKTPIELSEVFKEAKQRGKRKVVLMEGAPGCGKSTLSTFISQQWGEGKQFQEFEVLILVRLRDPLVQSAKSIADLLPSNENSTAAAQQALMEMNANNFQNVLLILDGWDELPSHLRKNSIFLDLIKPDLGQNRVLQESSVIVTSRPIASSNLHTQVSLRIEILGFTPSELKEYFSECLGGDAEAAESLIEKIEENPVISGICRLPLNASILVHLYKEQLGKNLPTSQYDIFSLLICTCVSRHLKERTQHKNITFESLDQILATSATAKQFKFLCELAYKGVMDDKITFSLPDYVDTLSLLQGVESFIKQAKTNMSYHFIHLSIQEVLAALYMAKWLTESKQVKKFNELFHKPRLMAVFQFYAAITKLKTSGIRDVIDQIGKRCGKVNPNDEAKILFMSLLHCLNESQDQSLCNLIIKHIHRGLDLGHMTVSLADCLSIGYFLSNVCKSSVGEFEMSLFNCNIDDQGCRYLVQGLQKCLETTAPGEFATVLNMNLKLNCIRKKGSGYLSELLQTGYIGALRLNGNHSLLDEGVKCISEQLSNNTSLKELGVYDCGITANSIDDIATALMTNKSLEVLNVGANAIFDDGIQQLANTLEYNQSLKSLNLACCGMTDIGLGHIVKSLQMNVSLTDLKIYNFLFQEHPNKITDKGDAIQCLFSCIKQRPTPLTLALPKDFKSSIADTTKDINDARTKSKMDLVDIYVDGHTLGEIEHKEEDQDDSESAQSDTTEQDSNSSEVSDIEEGDATKPSPTQAHVFHQAQHVQKSASFRYAEERAEIPFLHHQVLECDRRGLTHTVSDHDITLRVLEGAVPEGEAVHFEIGVTIYGPFSFPENSRPISPIIWLYLLEEDFELKEKFEIYVPHFLMHLSEQRIRYHQVCFAKAHHSMDKHDTSYTFRQFDSQPSFIFKDEKRYAILTSKHCCFLCLSAQNAHELAMDAGYCLVRVESLPREVHFLATFFMKTWLKHLEDQFGTDDKIARYNKFRFKKNDEQEPYIRMVIPSEYPNNITVAREPANLKIIASDIDFWNREQEYVKLELELNMYPPRMKVTVDMSDSTLHKFTLPIKFEGSLNEGLDTEVMFPLQSSISSSHKCELKASAGEVRTEKGKLKGKRKRSDSYEHTESCSKVARVNSPSSDEAEEGSEVPEVQNAVHTEISGSAASSSASSGEQLQENKINPKLATPTPKNLYLIKWMNVKGEIKQLRIKEMICNKWREIGYLLEISEPVLESWEIKHKEDSLKCIDSVMNRWLQCPTDEYPVSWEGLKKLLKDVKLSEVAQDIKLALRNAL